MRVLMTGHDGYIGAVLGPFLTAEGHDVVGLDTRYYRDCGFGDDTPRIPVVDRDLRDVRPDDLAGFDAIVHLAALSNDPVGDLNPECTYGINHRASLHLARLAKEVGVQRFLFSSSCSVYGASSPDDVLDEQATFAPITPYAESKVSVEHGLLELAGDDVQSNVPPQCDGVRRVAAPEGRRRGEQPRWLGRDHGKGRSQERRLALAPARPRRGRLPRILGDPRRAARRHPLAGLQRRDAPARTIAFARWPRWWSVPSREAR